MPSKDHVYKGRNVMLDDGKRKLIGVPQRSSSKNAESHLPQAWFAAWILSSYRGINALCPWPDGLPIARIADFAGATTATYLGPTVHESR